MELSWAQLDQAVDRAARGISARELPRGSRIGLLIGNSPDFAVAYFAALRAGLIVVPLNTAYTAPELTRVCVDAGLSLLLHDPGTARTAAAVGRRHQGLAVVSTDSDAGQLLLGAEAGGRGAFVGGRTGDRQAAVIMYTSGSEGEPKGAILSHGALRANLDAMARLRRPPALTPDDRLLLVVPMFHIYGLNSGLGLAARVGATCVLLERFDPRGSLAAIRDLGVTAVVGAPPMYVAWSAEGSLRESMDGVRILISGASSLSPDTYQQFQSITGHEIWEGYGLTECSPVVTTTLASGRPKSGSVGRAIPGIQVALRDLGGGEVDEGDPGEIWIRGKSLLTGYWPDASGGPDAQGWFRTGDVAVVDDDGDLHLVDRLRDLIIVSGFNVYPREVEAVLEAHPAVAEVAVLGMPHPLTGEAVKAVVVLRKGVPQPDDLRAFCEARLARFKCPVIFEFAKKLPHGATGKVSKGRLRSLRP